MNVMGTWDAFVLQLYPIRFWLLKKMACFPLRVSAGVSEKRGWVLELVEGLGFEEWFSAEKGFALGEFLETVDLLYRVFHDLFGILSLPEG